MRRNTWSLVGLVVLVMLVGVRSGYADTARHVRLETTSGPVHVYWPATYNPETAGIVVYVHGYSTTVDRAWIEHRLPQQFAASGIDAIFIACEAPTNTYVRVHWPHLAPLLAEVRERTEEELPTNRIVVVGHSGAHRTLSSWLVEGGMDTIVLVDALYGDKPQFREWLDADPDHRLIDTAIITRRWADSLHDELPETLTLDRFPTSPTAEWFEDVRTARVVYVRSQFDHMKLVTGGIAIPLLLRATRLHRLER